MKAVYTRYPQNNSSVLCYSKLCCIRKTLAYFRERLGQTFEAHGDARDEFWVSLV